MTNKRLLMATVIASVAAGISARAVDITTSAPGFTDSSAFAPGFTQEDNTVQSGATNDQTWDLEAFTASAGGKLGIVAGFDMKSGVASGHTSGFGDIFIKLNGPLNAINLNSSGYDYVVHFTTLTTVNGSNGSIITPGTTTGTGIGNVGYAIYKASDASVEYTGPNHITGGSALYGNVALYGKNFTGAAVKTGFADYTDNVSDGASGGYLGGNHDLITGIDLTGLGLNTATSIAFFATMGCGNDVLYGNVTSPTTFNFPTPDGGVTAALLGAGLIGLGVMRRRMA